MFRLITEWRIQKRVEEQFKAFLSGFEDLIPAELINVFDERELELLIGGIADIDVDDWKKHTDYRGYTETDEVIVNFWKASTLSSCDVIYTNFCYAVCSFMGLGAEVQTVAVYYRNVAHSSQRFQGFAG